MTDTERAALTRGPLECTVKPATTTRTIVDKQEWKAFIGDKAARKASETRWLELHAKLVEAERLLFDEQWTTDDPWPGVIYRGPTGVGVKAVDVETWTLMRALVRGMGEGLMRTKREAERLNSAAAEGSPMQ